MILSKYIYKKIFKNQLIILILLLLVCICQQLIKILGLGNNAAMYLIFLYLIFNIPELAKLTIPFSLFLSVIITFYRFHIQNEIIAMYSCGIKKYFFFQKILLYSFIIVCFAFINMSWLTAYCEQYQNNILYKIKKNVNFNKFIEKKFEFFPNKNLVLFIDTIDNKILYDVFIIKKRKIDNNDIYDIIIADQGSIYRDCNGAQSVVLQAGSYYKIQHNQTKHPQIYITNFFQNQMLINYNNTNFPFKEYNIISSMSIGQLWGSSTIATKIERNWRLTLLISILMMPLIALLFMTNITRHHLPNFLLAIILYTFFFVLNILLRSCVILHCSYASILIVFINCIFFIVSYSISLWKYFLLKIFFLKNIFNKI